MRDSSLSLHIDPAVLKPLIEIIVVEVLHQLQADRQQMPADGPLAYSEEQAARLLGLEPHQLRDERRRGRIGACSIVGRRVRYLREDLLGYLAARRVNVEERS